MTVQPGDRGTAATPRLIVHPTKESLAESIARRLEAAVAHATALGEPANIALTGGSIAHAAYQQLSSDVVNFSGVHWWWGDERFVAAGDIERNELAARKAFLDRFGVAEDRIHAMPAAGALSANQAAADYGLALPTAEFDVVLLGVGPDGHVASLFPGFSQLFERARRCVAVHQSPKPPPTRLTLTFGALNNAREVWFLVSGEEKSGAVARALSDGSIDDTPAVGVRGTQRTLWLVDRAAASAVQRRWV